MKHLGDINKINGAEIEPVDIIAFGSPCTDMSIAGKRAGLEGSQSCLFYEAVRIIREMRKATHGEYPKYAVWENVPGAFSSNKGEDFRCVLEALCSVKNGDVSVPGPEKWSSAGEILGDGYSIAWRVLDAQYWGVPQRRKRIYLVADFRGECAGKILFESEGVSGDPQPCVLPWQRTAGTSENCSGETSAVCLNDEGGSHISTENDLSPTLRAQTHGHPPAVMRSEGNFIAEPTYGIDRASCNMGKGAKFGMAIAEEVEPTMVAQGPCAVAHPVYTTSKSTCHTEAGEDMANTLVATDYKDPPTVTEEPYYIVRRLTPAECARLQGFPDWWTADLGTENPTDEEMAFWADVFETYRKAVTHAKKPKTENQIRKWLKDPSSVSAEYKMWGNGVALPNVIFVLSGIVYCAQF